MIDPENFRRYSDFITLGSEIAAVMIVPLLLGLYVDKHYNISPWGLIIGAFIGFVGFFNAIYHVIIRANQKRSEDQEDDEE